MVWIHGGGFTSGAGSDYGADQLVRNGSVVVTINYRVGAFGYFGFPGLDGSGAFGLRDQQAALGWVQRNIRRSAATRTTSRCSVRRRADCRPVRS